MVEEISSHSNQFHNCPNWLLINQYLQQLQQANIDKKQPSFELNSQDFLSHQQRLELSLKILEYGDFQQRWEVAKIIPQFGNIAISYLIKILEDETQDSEQRWFAGKILGEFDQPQVVHSLLNLLKTNPDEELRDITANALANLGTSAIQGLHQLLKQPEHRLLATKTLAKIRRSEVILSLLAVVYDPNPEVRAIVIETLGSFHDQRTFPILSEALNDPTSIVRKEAVMALGFWANIIDQSILLEHLQPLLYDLNLEICQQAAIAISRLNNDQSPQVLFPLLSSNTTPIPLQLTVIKCLGWLESRSSVNYLAQALTLVEPEIITEIIQVLGRLKNTQLISFATNILINFYKSQPPSLEQVSIRKILAYSLGNLDLNLAQTTLMELQKDQYPAVRLHAQTALKNIK